MRICAIAGRQTPQLEELHDMNANMETQVSVPARDNGLATTLKTGTATPLAPAAVPNGGTASRAWWAHIKALDHYDPAYPYDPRHVYGPDWTDDDAYGKDGVTFMTGPSHQTGVHGCHDEARRRLGPDRVFQERCLRLPDLGLPETNRYAKNGQIIPDVFIQEHPRPGEDEHEVAYDPDNPILFVLEVLSRSTFHRDLEPKVEIHRAMGVREYWRYDPRRWHRREGEPRLWGLRLSAEGEYEDIEPIRHEDGQPVYRSDTLGAFRMLDEGGNVHTLQTWGRGTRGLAGPDAGQGPGCRRGQAGGGPGQYTDHLPDQLPLPTETADCPGGTGIPCAGHPGRGLAESPVGARCRGCPECPGRRQRLVDAHAARGRVARIKSESRRTGHRFRRTP